MIYPSADLDLDSCQTMSSVGGDVTCRECDRSNPFSRRFCSGCGQTLWDHCPACQAECPADERFCGACGTDIAAEIERRQQAGEVALAAALALAKAHQYEAALAALAPLSRERDARLAALAERARTASQEVQRELDEQVAQARSALVHAQEQFAAFAYDRAASALEQVPAELMTPEHHDLLLQVQSRTQEIVALSAEIRAAIEEKRMSDLLVRLERLLALKPNHTQARQMAEQLAGNLFKRAKGYLAQHEYQQAVDQLEQVPSLVQNEELARLRDTASELATLLATVRGAALATPTLIALADRLCKLAPANAAAAKLRAQLVERTKTASQDPRLGRPYWTAPPARTFLGPPVEWLAKLIRAQSANASVERTLAENPGQFFTALGLALTGAGQAAIESDLTPRSKEGLLALLPAVGFGRRGAAVAWGIDLSDSGLKALRITVSSGGGVTIDQAECIRHAQQPPPLAAEAARADVMRLTLEKFLAGAGELKGVKTCIGLAGQRVLGRFFELPPMPRRKVAEAVQYEARHQLPVALDELCWSYAVQGDRSDKASDQAPRNVLLQAARETHVRGRLGLFKAAGLGIDFVQSDCVALHNALAFELSGPDACQGPGAVVSIVDVGESGTNVVISSPQEAWFRTVGLGGEVFRQQLVRQLEINYDQAATVLWRPAKARRFHQWQAAVQPLFVQLGSEIERSLATWQKGHADQSISRVFGLGGAFQTHGLLSYLRTGK